MYYNDKTIVYLNGEFLNANDVSANIYGQALHYGSAVFEGIRSYSTPKGTAVFKAREHYERLHYSAMRMNMTIPHTVQELTDITYKLLDLNKLKDTYIRPLIYPGENMTLIPAKEVNVFMAVWEWPKYLGDNLVRVMISPFQRPNPKSTYIDAKIAGHYVNSIMAATDARKKGFDEALLMDMNGFIAEGPGANFFYEKGGKLVTPSLGNILPGITRATLIDLAKRLGYTVEEKNISLNELKTADAAFFCGTAAEVSGIKSVDDMVFPMKWEETISSKLKQAYLDLVKQ
jgi:branched-chain amino acid aminotransferase